MIFKNFKEAHEYYKYPGTHRIGSYGNDKGIIKNNRIYYVLKNNIVEYKKKLRFFIKIDKGVKDMGLYNVKRFYKKYVVFEK